jgi:hypothetical protein
MNAEQAAVVHWLQEKAPASLPYRAESWHYDHETLSWYDANATWNDHLSSAWKALQNLDNEGQAALRRRSRRELIHHYKKFPYEYTYLADGLNELGLMPNCGQLAALRHWCEASQHYGMEAPAGLEEYQNA